MSKLAQHGRPYMAFNPSNKDHRKWFAQFQAQSTWAKCPVRFFIDDDAGDLITMIQRSLPQRMIPEVASGYVLTLICSQQLQLQR